MLVGLIKGKTAKTQPISMDYVPLQSQLSIRFEADDLDILQLGILNYHLHGLLNQVAIGALTEEDRIRQAEGDETLLDAIPQTLNRDDALIRARVSAVRQGSIELDLNTVVAALYSTPGAIAILQNLSADVIWAVGQFASRVTSARVLNWRKSNIDRKIPSVSARRKLSTKVEKFVRLLAESSSGGRIYLRSGDEELEIEFNHPKRPNNKYRFE